MNHGSPEEIRKLIRLYEENADTALYAGDKTWAQLCSWSISYWRKRLAEAEAAARFHKGPALSDSGAMR